MKDPAMLRIHSVVCALLLLACAKGMSQGTTPTGSEVFRETFAAGENQMESSVALFTGDINTMNMASTPEGLVLTKGNSASSWADVWIKPPPVFPCVLELKFRFESASEQEYIEIAAYRQGKVSNLIIGNNNKIRDQNNKVNSVELFQDETQRIFIAFSETGEGKMRHADKGEEAEVSSADTAATYSGLSIRVQGEGTKLILQEIAVYDGSL